MARHFKLAWLMLTRRLDIDDPIAGPVSRARRLRWLIAFVMVVLYGAAAWYLFGAQR